MTRLFRDDIGHEPNLEPPFEPVPICPVCGAETDTYYCDKYGDIVGCSECIETQDAYDAI